MGTLSGRGSFGRSLSEGGHCEEGILCQEGRGLCQDGASVRRASLLGKGSSHEGSLLEGESLSGWVSVSRGVSVRRASLSGEILPIQWTRWQYTSN